MHLIENPKLANIGFELLTFYELLGHKQCFDAKLISFIPLPHEAQTKVLLVLN
jgi:hypothetical protein